MLARSWLIAILLTCGPAALSAASLTTHETRYYTLFTDLDPDEAREAGLRMTRMAEEYHSRTRDFSRAITKRLPCYLYKNPEDFYATGAPRSSAGYFNGRELVIKAGPLDDRTWHILQHEGFHQFANVVINARMPVWVNEGLAEYFGEAVFTGDGFVSGVIPQWRLQRMRETLAADKFRPLERMMWLTLEEWNADLAVVNYDQGWSMVHFLAHGENGKYQRAFGKFMGQLGNGKSWQEAWRQAFGDITGFDQRWRQYWSTLPDNPTADLYTQAHVARWTSILGRAAAQKASFETFEALQEAAASSRLKFHADDWLPPALISDTVKDTEKLGKAGYVHTLSLPDGQRLPQVVCTMPDGRRIIGRYTIRADRIGTVTTEVPRRRPDPQN